MKETFYSILPILGTPIICTSYPHKTRIKQSKNVIPTVTEKLNKYKCQKGERPLEIKKYISLNLSVYLNFLRIYFNVMNIRYISNISA